MSAPPVKRKLAAILSADVKGYSRLMGEDEEWTVRTLNTHKAVIRNLVEQHRGRVVDSPGDNVLAEFGSVVDAVQCAVEIQQVLKAKNALLPESRRMEFRIGINLGDVIEEEERIYGDGVNIAARMEGLAEGGGICVSGTVYEHVRNKLPLECEFLGEHAVKNIAEPVRVYRVGIETEAPERVEGVGGRVEGKSARRETQGARRRPLAVIVAVAVGVVVLLGGGAAFWEFVFRPTRPEVERADQKKMAFPLPEKPSIAVLPFTNLSQEPKHEHFVDGMTEEIITTLSKASGLFVIASNSVFTYKGKPIKVQQVSQDLGVRYVLEGSVRRSEDRVRVTAQLIDAISGHHLWSERYDRVLQDVFAVQDDITQRIVTALEVKLTEGEQARLRRQTTKNVEAWELYSKGLEQSRIVTKAGNAEAQRKLEAAVALDPNFAAAWALLGHTYLLEAWIGWAPSPAKSLDRAVELARKAIGLDDTLGEPHMTLGAVHLLRRQHDEAISAGERAVALNPNSATITVYLGRTFTYSGRPTEGIEVVKRAMRLSPKYPPYYLAFVAWAYRAAGRYEEAIEASKRWMEINPEGGAPSSHYLNAAVCYALLGREAEARTAAVELLRMDPGYSMERFRRGSPYKNPADLERELEALRKLGFPETPPPPLPDKPSIAVLPFANMSDDPKQEFFSDGLTEEIITALSKVPRLFVIARNSTFAYKGKQVNVQQVGRELGVKHVLEGSVRRAGAKVRITAQLIDATTGSHVWAERYDRDLKEIFALQDEITLKILLALQVRLTGEERVAVTGKGTNNLEAYLKLLQASERYDRLTREGTRAVGQLAQEAIALDPEYAMAYLRLSAAHIMDATWGWSESPEQSLRTAEELINKAVSLDSTLAEGYAFLGRIYLAKRQHDRAIAEGERALAMAPNVDFIQAALAYSLQYSGQPEAAAALYRKAIRANPFPPTWYLTSLGACYRQMGRHEEAIAEYKKALHRTPDIPFAHLNLAATYSLMGQIEDARAEAQEALRLDPKFTLEHLAKSLPFRDQKDTDQFIEALRKAGLK